jgi:hypothetical protein
MAKKWIILLPMIPPFYQPLREIPRQDRQKNGGRRCSAFILHPSTFILCLALALTPAERVASLIDPAKLAVDALASSSLHFNNHHQ